MGGLSVWHWLIFLAVALLFFGGSGKISAIMGDFAKGIKSFKKGLQDDAEDAAKKKADEAQKTIEAQKAPEVQSSGSGTKVG
jgi:sec-independent protein translocase protein TatA